MGGRGGYDTAVHVGALILILALSVFSTFWLTPHCPRGPELVLTWIPTACGLPLMSRSSNRSPFQKKFVFYCQHVGTGVLLATAFVHLLPTAFTSLTNPCLPDAFSKRYTPMAGLVAMVSALVVVGVESYLSAAGAGHVHTMHGSFWDDDESVDAVPVSCVKPDQEETGGLATRRHRRPTDIRFLHDIEASESEGLVGGISPRPGETPLPSGNVTPMPRKESQEVDADGDSDIELDLNELDPVPVDETRRPLNGPAGAPLKMEPTLPHGQNSATPEEQKRLFVQCLLLEAGILFHSLFIGMALSVATGPTFVVFLIAISFHTSFEGLALGARIAAIQLPKASIRPWLMVLAFGMTTPIGQAIGLIIHNMYDPHSQTGLLLVGFMNAISSGLLLFAGLVQLLAEDFLTEKSYHMLKGRRRVQAFASVVGGALLMAAVRALA